MKKPKTINCAYKLNMEDQSKDRKKPLAEVILITENNIVKATLILEAMNFPQLKK